MNTALDLSSKIETLIPSPKKNAVSVSSDDDSVTSGIASSSSKDLKPRRVVASCADSSEPETEGSQSSATSQTQRSLNKRCRDL